MNPIVSIIVPVYNAQEYLKHCVDSILQQEYKDFELILVNDGSTDGSGSLCDQYAAHDPRVRVFHKENTGVSDTRNLALDQAKGTYLQFLDSDDWITPDATKLLVRAATEHQCDLVIADFYRVIGEHLSHKGDIDETDVLTREEFASHMMENPADFYYGVLWNKLYKREIVERYEIRMDKTISWCEDFIFNMEYFLHAESFYALQAPIYYYLKRKGSLVSQSINFSKTVQMKLTVFDYYNQFYKNIYDEKDYSKKRPQVYRFLIDAASDGMLPPSILPSVKKLGQERINSLPALLSGDGLVFDDYRRRKLMDRYLEVIALKHDLTLKDVKFLYHISHMNRSTTRKELADFMGVSATSLTLTMQKLILRNYISITDMELENVSDQLFFLEIHPAASPVIDEIRHAISDYDEISFSNFSQEEQETYRLLHQKIQANLADFLKN